MSKPVLKWVIVGTFMVLVVGGLGYLRRPVDTEEFVVVQLPPEIFGPEYAAPPERAVAKEKAIEPSRFELRMLREKVPAKKIAQNRKALEKCVRPRVGKKLTSDDLARFVVRMCEADLAPVWPEHQKTLHKMEQCVKAFRPVSAVFTGALRKKVVESNSRAARHLATATQISFHLSAPKEVPFGKDSFQVKVTIKNGSGQPFHLPNPRCGNHYLSVIASKAFDRLNEPCVIPTSEVSDDVTEISSEYETVLRVFVKAKTPGRYPLKIKYSGFPEMETNEVFVQLN